MYVLAQLSGSLIRKDGAPVVPPSLPPSILTSHGYIVVASFIASPQRRHAAASCGRWVHRPLQKYGRSSVRLSVRSSVLRPSSSWQSRMERCRQCGGREREEEGRADRVARSIFFCGSRGGGIASSLPSTPSLPALPHSTRLKTSIGVGVDGTPQTLGGRDGCYIEPLGGRTAIEGNFPNEVFLCADMR